MNKFRIVGEEYFQAEKPYAASSYRYFVQKRFLLFWFDIQEIDHFQVSSTPTFDTEKEAEEYLIKKQCCYDKIIKQDIIKEFK